MNFFSTLFAQAVNPLSGQTCTGDKTRLLGLIPRWYTYLPMRYDAGGQCTVVAVDFGKNPEQFLLLGVAIVSALTTIAGAVAFVYILYGGFQYVVSQGEPDNTKKALETIRNAVIGLVIAASATVIVSFVGNRLGA